MLYTYRGDETHYAHQILIPSDKQNKSFKLLFRVWDEEGNAWTSFQTLNGTKFVDSSTTYQPNTPITYFSEEQITVIPIRNTDASSYGLSAGGVIEVFRYRDVNYSFQRYTSIDGGTVLNRKWDDTLKKWKDWIKPTNVVFTRSISEYPANAPLTTFPLEKVTILKVGSNFASEYGLDSAGIIEVFRLNELDYGFQRYTSLTGVIKVRNWNPTTNGWKNWV